MLDQTTHQLPHPQVTPRISHQRALEWREIHVERRGIACQQLLCRIDVQGGRQVALLQHVLVLRHKACTEELIELVKQQ